MDGKGDDAGVDDQMPILNYAFIKAQALRMFSNIRFISNKKLRKMSPVNHKGQIWKIFLLNQANQKKR